MCGGWTFITGGTGFIGQYVIAELLLRGERCIALVRGDRVERLGIALSEIQPELGQDDGRLLLARGELPHGLPAWNGPKIARVVHVAGNTSFGRSGAEPSRTNVEGTARLLSWMDHHLIADLTHVSTAYVCGAASDVVLERIERLPPRFLNDYEASKWAAEQLAADWAAHGQRRLIVARPSIVTGAYSTGRATEFRGFYAIARAVEQLSRSYEGRPRAERLRVPLRLRGFANAPNQIVPVDSIANAIVSLALNPDAAGVFHLAHPHPPTNGGIKQMLETIFDVGGGTFVKDDEIPTASQSREELAFYGGLQPLGAYFSRSPQFDCSRARAALGRDAEFPRIDLAYVRRCIAFAKAHRWGRLPKPRSNDAARFGAAYFERFLPAYLPQSSVSRVQPVKATIRFVIDNQEWTCRFADGRLDSVRRGADGDAEEFGYQTSTPGFWRAISGKVDGEELFAAGEAHLFGDIEAALKMSAILREFTREFPCDRARLERYLESA